MMKEAEVVAVSKSAGHSFSKPVQEVITLIAGAGVQGDAHQGAQVKHRSRVRRDPHAPNLRQVHLLHSELLVQLAAAGFSITPGQIGENITTINVPLLDLPRGTRLQLGARAVVEVTGLRNPCTQLDEFLPGLKSACLDRDDKGQPVYKAGIMSVVVRGGDVRASDRIRISLPPPPHEPLTRV